MPQASNATLRGMSRTELAGTRVLFNGFPAPLLYVSKGQINAVVPFELAGSTRASVQVVQNGVNFNSLDVPVLDAAPAVFTVDVFGQAAVLNEDGSLNSVSNPARQGSIISIFATGAWSAGAGSIQRPGALRTVRQTGFCR